MRGDQSKKIYPGFRSLEVMPIRLKVNIGGCKSPSSRKPIYIRLAKGMHHICEPPLCFSYMLLLFIFDYLTELRLTSGSDTAFLCIFRSLTNSFLLKGIRYSLNTVR